MIATPDGAHDATFSAPAEPIWHGDADDWHAGLEVLQRLTAEQREEERAAGREVYEREMPSARSIAVARMVLYTAAQYNTLFSHPIEPIIECWAGVFEYGGDWLTIGLAEAAVHAYFASATDGTMQPGDVVREAKKINRRTA